jgi:hypothetical protein
MLDVDLFKVNDVTAGGAVPQWFPVLMQRIQFRL